MESKNGKGGAMIVLRVLSLGLLVASAIVLATNSFKTSDGEKTSFKDIYAYRYVVATAAVGVVYLLIQLPFAAYYAATGKRMVGRKLLPEFNFYADKVVALVLASGVGAGFAITFELKRLYPDIFDTLIVLAQASGPENFANLVPLLEEGRSKTLGFFDRGYIASALLLAACLVMLVVSVLSSINRTK